MMRWNSTKTYTEDDILRMQQEAVSRVHEFQSRAQEAASYYDMPTIGESHPYPMLPVIEAESRMLPESPPQSDSDTPEPPPEPDTYFAQPDGFVPQTPPPPTDPIRGLLEKLDLDGETLLILGLIFLLHNEQADNVLLIALAYLLL